MAAAAGGEGEDLGLGPTVGAGEGVDFAQRALGPGVEFGPEVGTRVEGLGPSVGAGGAGEIEADGGLRIEVAQRGVGGGEHCLAPLRGRHVGAVAERFDQNTLEEGERSVVGGEMADGVEVERRREAADDVATVDLEAGERRDLGGVVVVRARRRRGSFAQGGHGEFAFEGFGAAGAAGEGGEALAEKIFAKVEQASVDLAHAGGRALVTGGRDGGEEREGALAGRKVGGVIPGVEQGGGGRKHGDERSPEPARG